MNRKNAEKMATEHPSSFFFQELDLEYPDLVEIAAKELTIKRPYDFFRYKLFNSFPELEELAVKKLFRNYNFEYFLFFNLHKKYPKYLLLKHERGKDISIWLEE